MSQAQEVLQVYVRSGRDCFETHSAPLKDVFGYTGKPVQFAIETHPSNEGLLAHLEGLPKGSGISFSHDVFGALPQGYRERLAEMGAQVNG